VKEEDINFEFEGLQKRSQELTLRISIYELTGYGTAGAG